MLQTAPMYANIPVKDLARARQFYEVLAGLKTRVILVLRRGSLCGERRP